VDEPIGEGAVEVAIELTAPPEEGAGEVSTFAWEPVDGAAAYRLVVLDAEAGRCGPGRVPIPPWPSAGFPTGRRGARARC
jgi:hypothetical protein